VPWHYDQIRQTVPPIHDITTDPDNPPVFVAVVPLRQGEGINSVALMLKRYGEKALGESAARADELAAGDDHNGAATWRRITDVVSRLANLTPHGALH
jgi:hypothetical protein